MGDGRVLDILGCSPKLSHTLSLVAMGYGAHLSYLRSVSFRFSSLLFPLNKFFLHSKLKPTKLLLTRLSLRPRISFLHSPSVNLCPHYLYLSSGL